MKFDPLIIKQQVANLLLAFPELAEDEVLRGDMLEAETGLNDFLRGIERQRREALALATSLGEIAYQYQERAARFARRDEALRKLMFDLLQTANLKKMELPEATLSVRNGVPRVVIVDEKSLPKEFLRVRTEPDKTLIKQALSNGEHVEGAALSNAEPTISIRVK